MGKVSLMFFRKDCMGCHACEVACKQEHELGLGPRLVRVIERSPVYTQIYCHHCAKAPCLESCPTEAISRNAQGIVLIEEELCIGCKACVEAYPFGAMQFDEDHDRHHCYRNGRGSLWQYPLPFIVCCWYCIVCNYFHCQFYS